MDRTGSGNQHDPHIHNVGVGGAGLEEITAGDLTIAGQRANDVPASKRGLAMVFQSYALYPHMTVEQNMSVGLRIAGAPKTVIREKVDAAARILQLDELLDRINRELGGDFDLLPERGYGWPAFINLQQYYAEQWLIEEAKAALVRLVEALPEPGEGTLAAWPLWRCTSASRITTPSTQPPT